MKPWRIRLGLSPLYYAGSLKRRVGRACRRKATWLERHGREFELPEGHIAAWRDLHGKPCVSLEAIDGGGGQYYLEDIEEDDERVLIHVGEHVWETGYGEGSPSAELPAGYPFPT
jgi:hypothetical protein